MSEKTVAEAREKELAERRQDTREAWNVLLSEFGERKARAIEWFVTATGNEDRLTFGRRAESLAPQPKAEAGEPSGEAPEPLPEVLPAGTRTTSGRYTGAWTLVGGDARLIPNKVGKSAPVYEAHGIWLGPDGRGHGYVAAASIDWAHWRSTRAATTATDAGSGGASKEELGASSTARTGKPTELETNHQVGTPPEPVHPSQEQPAASGPGKPSGGAPSDSELSVLYCSRLGSSLKASQVERHVDALRALFEAGAASRDADVAAYERFVNWAEGLFEGFEGTARKWSYERAEQLRRELAALEAKAGK